MAAASKPKAAVAAKRRRSTKEAPPRKRHRSESVSGDDGGDDDGRRQTNVQDRILQLESQILESKKHLNNIVELLEIAKSSGGTEDGGDDDDDDDDDPSPALAAAVALCRVFIRLLSSGSLALDRRLSDKDAVVVRWLRDRLSELERVILGFFDQSGEAASTALNLAMRLLQAEGESARKKDLESGGGTYTFPQAFLTAIVRGVLQSWATLGSGAGERLADEFAQTYAKENCDVRFYTCKAVAAIVGGEASTTGDATTTTTTTTPATTTPAAERAVASGALHLLSQFDAVPASSDALDTFFVRPAPQKRSHALYSVARHRKQAQDAWVAVLGRAASAAAAAASGSGSGGGSAAAAHKDLRKRALGITSTVIAPWFAQPELLLDFLTDCYDAGGSTSLLALSGLYYLIRERNVDYPAFYAKLYSLLDAQLLHSKHRSRFFRLMDTFLASTHLPVQLVASFVKRLARLCLHAPPSATVSVVPWIYNMLKTHPLCTFMIHRVPRTAAERAALLQDGLADPFRPDEADPMQTRAIDSCLWEVVQLQSHYHPNVATIARIISEQFTKQSYNVEDFLDHSYQSMFEAEIKKEVKRAPVVEFHIPKRIFLPHDPDAGAEDGLLVKLWDFA